jgi:hypothetical protein
MVLRGMLGIIGDVQQIASGETGALTHTALWDLALWAPLFLIWVCCGQRPPICAGRSTVGRTLAGTVRFVR